MKLSGNQKAVKRVCRKCAGIQGAIPTPHRRQMINKHWFIGKNKIWL